MSNASRRRSRRHPDEHELVQAVDSSAALRQLLAAASAPPSTAELKGRARAIAAFRAAQRRALHPHQVNPVTGQAGPDRRAPARLARAGRWSAARLTVACTALVVLLGGTAAAAAAGELPAALQNAVSDLLNTPAPAGDRPAPAPASSSAEATVQPEPRRTGSAPSSAPNPPGSSTAAGRAGASAASPPQLVGLCRAYQAAGSVEAATLLARPGFAPLVMAADGVPKVATFCVQLTGPAPAAHPWSPHRPGAHPATPPAAAAQAMAVSQPQPGPAHSRPQPRAGERGGPVSPAATHPLPAVKHAAHTGSGAPVERPNSRQ